MPSATLLPEEKAIIRKAIGHECQIFTATVVRLYVAHPDPNCWTFTQLMGAIAFMKDLRKNNAFFFRLVDLQTGQVVWEQELYRDFQYYQERPFFHSFATDSFMIGFSFADQNEAAALYTKVTNRDSLRIQSKGNRPSSFSTSVTPVSAQPPIAVPSPASIAKKAKGGKGKIDKSLIGAPTNFRHLTHIGWDPEKGFSTINIPPEWKKVFDRAGVTEEQLKDQSTAKFIFDFMSQHADTSPVTDPPPPGPPSDNISAPSNRRGAPPPPPPVRAPSAPAPPAQRGMPPPIPNRAGGAPPPPVAPPVPSMGAPPPPMAPAAPMAKLPPASNGRNALLESIRGAGVGALRKVDVSEASHHQDESASANTSQGDVASALRNALSSRQAAMGGPGVMSDSEHEEDDDEW